MFNKRGESITLKKILLFIECILIIVSHLQTPPHFPSFSKKRSPDSSHAFKVCQVGKQTVSSLQSIIYYKCHTFLHSSASLDNKNIQHVYIHTQTHTHLHTNVCGPYTNLIIKLLIW